MGSSRGLQTPDLTLSLWSRIPSRFFRGSVTGPVPESRPPPWVSIEQEACEKALKSFLPAEGNPSCQRKGSDAALGRAHVWVHSDPILLGDEPVLSVLLCVDPLFQLLSILAVHIGNYMCTARITVKSASPGPGPYHPYFFKAAQVI